MEHAELEQLVFAPGRRSTSPVSQVACIRHTKIRCGEWKGGGRGRRLLNTPILCISFKMVELVPTGVLSIFNRQSEISNAFCTIIMYSNVSHSSSISTNFQAFIKHSFTPNTRIIHMQVKKKNISITKRPHWRLFKSICLDVFSHTHFTCTASKLAKLFVLVHNHRHRNLCARQCRTKMMTMKSRFAAIRN